MNKFNEVSFLKAKEKYLGKEFVTNEGCVLRVIEYNHDKNIKVEFECGYTKVVSSTNLNRGEIKNPNHRSVCSVGYIGVGKYKAQQGRKQSTCYKAWICMLNRCYKASENLFPTYIGCTVCDKWHNFQNFAEWYNSNYREGFHLDKDILIKGNKVYSEDTCDFVPKRINQLFVKSSSIRGNYMIGVSKSKSKFEANINILGIGKVHLGRFDTELEAFNAYKVAKEAYIKEVAEEWRDEVSVRVYEALINYQVEITD